MNRAVVLVFLAIVSLPLAANLVDVDGGDAQAENRDLATMPRLDGSATSLVNFPQGFNRWFEDHFGFRSTLVRLYGEARLFGLGVSPSSAVVKGSDGWFYYADDGAMEDYTNETPLSSGDVRVWTKTLVGVRDWLKARGIAYVFAIAPDKHVIYPEALPASIRRVGPTSRSDQVFDALADTGVAAIDARPALLAAKRSERVFQKLDTHWNDRGAFVAYQLVVAALRKQTPSVPPAWTRDDFDAREHLVPAGDLAGMMGLRRVLREADLVLVPRRPRQAHVIEPPGAEASAEEGLVVTEIPGSSLPRAVIFRDSFASALAPFLSEHFSRAVYLWQNDFDADVVLKEHPDVVIQEIVGRHLYNFLPSPELIPSLTPGR